MMNRAGKEEKRTWWKNWLVWNWVFRTGMKNSVERVVVGRRSVSVSESKRERERERQGKAEVRFLARVESRRPDP